MDDFMSPEPFRKGKSKVVELKAWQSRQGEKVTVSKFRCWDDPLGCEAFKVSTDFRFHPRICNACSAAISTRYGVKQSEMPMLGLILTLDHGLFKSVRYLKAPADKVEALDRAKEIHVKRLMDSIQAAGANQSKIKAVHKAYRDWFYAQAEVELEKPKGAQGFASVAAMLPVGDR